MLDLTNQKFGSLTARWPVGRSKYGVMWLVSCECGKLAIIRAYRLKAGDTRSCGCMRYVGGPPKHNQSGNHGNGRKPSPTYMSWRSMHERCLNKNVERYPAYGGANPPITICDRWLGPDGFTNFLVDLGERPTGTSIGRKGDVGNYEPGNVSWQTPADQVANWRSDRTRPWSKKKAVEQTAEKIAA